MPDFLAQYCQSCQFICQVHAHVKHFCSFLGKKIKSETFQKKSTKSSKIAESSTAKYKFPYAF